MDALIPFNGNSRCPFVKFIEKVVVKGRLCVDCQQTGILVDADMLISIIFHHYVLDVIKTWVSVSS